MKKILLSLVFVIGTCVFVSAQEVLAGIDSASASEVVISSLQDDGFVEVQLTDLNEKVQAAIKGFEGATVKNLAYNADKKQTKVTLVSGEGEKVVILDDEGNEVK